MIKLTDEQEAFIDAEGKVVLWACPGSGKTFAVAHKVLKYLRMWEYSHQGMAILSFTNVASKEIKRQTEIMKGIGVIQYPHYIGTVDSFIDTYIVLQYGYLKNDKISRPQIVLNDLWRLPYYWRTECYKKQCVDNISDFHIGVDGKFYKNKTIVDCIPNRGQSVPPCLQYKNMLAKKGIIFQSEVSSFAYFILKENPEIAQAIAQRFPVIIVDEAQDTSEEQMAVFDLLFEAGIKSAFLVGDPDQSIYEWRNATPSCFNEKVKHSDWQTLYFKDNYRSSQNICNAVKYFSSTQEAKMANNAAGIYAEESQKPILLLYDIGKENEEIYSFFFNKCKEMKININSKTVAILTRDRIYDVSGIKELWKSKEIEILACAGYEWCLGSRKKAFSLCERAVYSILTGEFADSLIINNNITKILDEMKWRNLIINIIVNISDVNLSLEHWIVQVKSILDYYLKPMVDKFPCLQDTNVIIKIKSWDKKYPDFKKRPFRNFFDIKTEGGYARSSVHGVKGETYDAVLLHVHYQKGPTLTPTFLNSGSLDSELMRIAYVAITRPRRLLVVAMPRNKKDIYIRFHRELWEYISI